MTKAAVPSAEAPVQAAPRPKVVAFPEDAARYVRLLGGPPETESVRSGLVTLPPGTSVGAHSTEGHEEVIVPLSGDGELRIPGREAIPIRPGTVLYTPPRTQHDVVNVGGVPLRYVYVVTGAPSSASPGRE